MKYEYTMLPFIMDQRAEESKKAEQIMNALGKQGWKLVSIQRVIDGMNMFCAFFMREVSEEVNAS